MKISKFFFSAYILFSLFTLAGCRINQDTPLTRVASFPDVALEITFFDSKESVCIFIEIDDHTIVIDSGLIESESSLLEFINNYNIHSIDYLIITHPIEDYLERIETISAYTEIRQIILPNFFVDNVNSIRDFVEESNFPIKTIDSTEEFEIRINGLNLTVYPSLNTQYFDLNSHSLITSIQYTNQFVLFAGDATSENLDKFILKNNLPYDLSENINYTVLLLPNHGADAKYLEEFLYKINPTHGIISCSVTDEMSSELLQLLLYYDVQTFLTCDGKITIRLSEDSLHISQQIPKFTLI